MKARVVALVRSSEFTKLCRYVTVSGISTVISLILLFIFYREIGLSPGWANLVATVVCTPLSYYLNRSWAWKRTGKSHFRREVLPFWVIALVSLGLSTVAVIGAAHEAHHIASSKHVQTALVLFANFFTYGVMWMGKYALFNKVLFRHHGPIDDDGEPIVLVPATSSLDVLRVGGGGRGPGVDGDVAAEHASRSSVAIATDD